MRERLIDVWHKGSSLAGSWKLRESICEIAESRATHDGDQTEDSTSDPNARV